MFNCKHSTVFFGVSFNSAVMSTYILFEAPIIGIVTEFIVPAIETPEIHVAVNIFPNAFNGRVRNNFNQNCEEFTDCGLWIISYLYLRLI